MSADSKSDMEGSPAAEVDRIRDIIFGPQMRVYEKQFGRLSNLVDQMGKQVEQLRAAVEQQRAESEENLQQETSQVREESRQSLEQLRGELSGRIEQQAVDQKTQVNQLTADLRKQGQDLRSEITSATNSLEDEKAGRHDMGDMLVEMGMRLKDQIGLGDLLGQLEVSEGKPEAPEEQEEAEDKAAE